MSTSTYYPVCIKNIRIYAWDNQGHQTTSNISTFVVGNSDQIGPYIRMISGPEIIISTETSKISVNGTDASEVTAVILSYNNGQAWINNSMSQNGTIWMGEIPPPGDVPTLQYKVFAKDTWGAVVCIGNQ